MADKKYRYSVGPWNISEGADPYGPTVREPKDFDWKLPHIKKAGFDAIMFHDDDAVPDIDSKSSERVLAEARDMKKKLDDNGLFAEIVAPRLWFAPQTIDGGYTSNRATDRQYARRPLEANHRHCQRTRLRFAGAVAGARRHLRPRKQRRKTQRRTAGGSDQRDAGARSEKSASRSSRSPTNQWIRLIFRPSGTRWRWRN